MKNDYKKIFSALYQVKPGEFVTVDVPPMHYLMVDGQGDPNTAKEYIDAIHALYPVAYALKFMCKKELGLDFSVMPLEGLWWADDMSKFSTEDKSNWRWTAMIMQPEIITKEMVERARMAAAAKPDVSPALRKLRFAQYTEGRAAQTLFIGPYKDEGPTIQKLHRFIVDEGGALTIENKHHHEIYLSDPRRTEPGKLKTIIRQPY